MIITRTWASWLPGEHPEHPEPEPDLPLLSPDEHQRIEQRLSDLDRRVRYLEERLRTVEHRRHD